MADGNYPNGRLVCRLRNDANTARRHELAVARLAAAIMSNDVDGMLAALPDIDHAFRRRLIEGFEAQRSAR